MAHKFNSVPDKRQIEELVKKADFSSINAVLSPFREHQVVKLLKELSTVDQAVIFRSLNKNRAGKIFSNLSLKHQHELVHAFSDEHVVELIEHMHKDARTSLLEELPANVVSTVLASVVNPFCKWRHYVVPV